MANMVAISKIMVKRVERAKKKGKMIRFKAADAQNPFWRRIFSMQFISDSVNAFKPINEYKIVIKPGGLH